MGLLEAISKPPDQPSNLDRDFAIMVMGYTVRSGATEYDGLMMPWTVYLDRDGETLNPIFYERDLSAAWAGASRLPARMEITVYGGTTTVVFAYGTERIGLGSDTNPAKAIAHAAVEAAYWLSELGKSSDA